MLRHSWVYPDWQESATGVLRLAHLKASWFSIKWTSGSDCSRYRKQIAIRESKWDVLIFCVLRKPEVENLGSGQGWAWKHACWNPTARLCKVCSNFTCHRSERHWVVTARKPEVTDNWQAYRNSSVIFGRRRASKIVKSVVANVNWGQCQ